jgi:arsenate reductase (glutaredoxin)
MLTIYHNPRCSKSREGLTYLTRNGYEFKVILYLHKPFKTEEFKKLLMKLNLKPEQVVRTQEEIYRKELKGRTFTYEEWIRIIIQNPKLIQSPIVEGKYRAVIADPPERSEEVRK